MASCRGTEEWKKNVGQGVSRALKGKPKSQEHRMLRLPEEVAKLAKY